MHIVRTIVWVLLAVWGLFFFGMNWGEPVPVKFWPIPINNPLMFEWPVSLVAIVFFLAGLVPAWLLGRAQKWMLKRRIHSLEQAARHVPAASPMPMPATMPEPMADPITDKPLTTDPEPQPENRPPLA